MDVNTLRIAQAQAAVDRKVAVGLGEGFANPFSFVEGLALPAGYTLYVVGADRDSGTAFALGGDGTSVLLYRMQAGRAWRDISSALPVDATGDGRALAHEGTTWWVGGVTSAAGGWLAVSVDDGVTWTSWTIAAGISTGVLALADVLGVILYVGCADGNLYKWTAPATWADLSVALGFGTDDVLSLACDGVAGVMAVGGDAAPTVTAAYSGDAGATWTDRTAALATAAPVRVVTRLWSNAYVVGGDATLRATYDNGVHWEDWAVHADLAYLYPIYDAVVFWEDVLLLATGAGFVSVSGRGSAILPLAKIGTAVRTLKVTISVIYLATDILAVSAAGGTVATVSVSNPRMFMRPGFATRLQGVGTHVVRYGSGLLISVLLSTTAAVQEDVVLYDNSAAAGAVIATVHLPAAAAPFEWRPPYPVRLTVGLTVVLASNGQDVTVVLE